MNPLSGALVLDFSRILAGPFCTMLLADLGAEVIKIEEPEKGDESRHYGPPFIEGTSTYFLSVNRGKKSVTLNLEHPTSKNIILNLIPKADIVVENFRPGTMAKFGLDYPTLSGLNPKLIYCSISGFGQSGSWSNKPGYDLVIQGMSGLMDLTGAADGPPFKVGTSIADLVTGLYAVSAILAAMLERQTSGKGRVLDLALLDSLTSLLTYQAARTFAGESATRMGNDHPSITPYETFRAADGYLNVAVGNDRLWKLFCRMIGSEELLTNPQFSTNQKRVEHRESLREKLDVIFIQKTVADWISRLEEAGIPAGPILSVPQILDSKTLKERNMLESLKLNETTFPFLLNPLRRLHAANTDTPPPHLGEHTEEILKKYLGLLPAEVEALRREKAI